MNPARREQINRLAEIVRQGCELTTPVNLDELVKRLEGQMAYSDSAEFEAMVERQGDGFQISLSSELKNPSQALRKRFTIAHEIGHLLLHMGYLDETSRNPAGKNFRDSVYYRFGVTPEEHEANEFAAALLMPKEEFIKTAWNNLEDGKVKISPIAQHFQVSNDAAVNRGRWLKIFSWT